MSTIESRWRIEVGGMKGLLARLDNLIGYNMFDVTTQVVLTADACLENGKRTRQWYRTRSVEFLYAADFVRILDNELPDLLTALNVFADRLTLQVGCREMSTDDCWRPHALGSLPWLVRHVCQEMTCAMQEQSKVLRVEKIETLLYQLIQGMFVAGVLVPDLYMLSNLEPAVDLS